MDFAEAYLNANPYCPFFRRINVVCSHPRKPREATYRFRQPIVMYTTGNEWKFDNRTLLPGNYTKPVGASKTIRIFTKDHDPDHHPEHWSFEWVCPVRGCPVDLPLKPDTLLRLISILDQLEAVLTGGLAETLDISRAQLLLRCASQAGRASA